jgi:type I restriction enzyme, S subunit
MMSWPLVSLSEILTETSDPVSVNPAEKYPNLGLYSYARGAFGKPDIDGAQTSAKTLYRVRGGQFIYSRLFAFEGAYAVVPNEMDGCFVSNEYPVFVHDRERVDIRYLRWLLSTPFVWREIAIGSKGLGGRRQRVHPAQVLSFKTPLPPLEEQQRIAGRLDRAAELIVRRSEAIAAAEAEMKQLLAKAFARCIDGAPRRPMSEVAPLVRRPVEIDAAKEYTEIGVRSFYKGVFHRRTMLGSEFSWQKLSRINEGDLVFSNLMAWEQAIAIAAPEDDGTVGNHRMLTCEVNPDLALPGFLFAYFQTAEGFADVVGHSPGTIARNKTLSSRRLPTVEVPVPALETQHWYEALQAKARRIQQLRVESAADIDALMPSLLDEVFGQRPAAA